MNFRWLILLVFLFRTSQCTDVEEIVVVDILTNSTSLEEPTEDYTCECNDDDLIEKGNYTLTVEVKNMQVRLVEPFRDAIAYVASEKKHLLDFIKFVTLRDIRASYPLLLNYTDFYESFDELIVTVKNVMTTENTISLSSIKYEVSTAVQKFLNNLLPNMFLCLSVGKCRTVPLEYHNCMLRSTEHWSIYIGNTPNKMAMTISEAIYRYRKVEFLLVDMHKQLMSAQNTTITDECVTQYVHSVPCNCTVPGIVQCQSSCSNSMETCFGKFSREWAAKLHLMRNMTNSKKTFLDEFLTLKKTIFSVIRMFVERKSFVYAEHVYKSCGPLGEMIIHPSKHVAHFRSPGPFISRADSAVRELQLSAKSWDRFGRKICDHTGVVVNPGMCYDGTKIIKVEHELPPITKDVRPRPMMDWIEKKNEKKIAVEGSGSPLWDDEDSDAFEGSGSGMPPIIIDRNPVKAVIQEDHPKNIDLSTNPKGPSVIVSEQGNQPDGSSTVSVLTSLVLITIINLL